MVSQTRCLARALAPDIRVNAVASGLTRTAWTDPWFNDRKSTAMADQLLSRMVEPEDIVSAMLSLCVSAAITAQTIVVDCGRLA